MHLIKSPAGNGVGGAVSDTLQVLWLCDNPCAMEKDYRGKVIALMPALTKVRVTNRPDSPASITTRVHVDGRPERERKRGRERGRCSL